MRTWDWGVETGTLRVRTTLEQGGPPAAARLDVVDATGHPAVPVGSRPWFDGQSGRVYAYSTGIAEYRVPAGSATVAAVQGLATPEAARTVEVAARPDHRGRGDAHPRLGRARRGMGVGGAPLPPELRGALRPRPGRPGADDAGGGARCRDPPAGQPAQPVRGPGPVGLGAGGRGTPHPLRPGGALALSRPRGPDRHRRLLLAVGMGPRLPGVRHRRPRKRGGAGPRPLAGRLRVLRASGERARRRARTAVVGSAFRGTFRPACPSSW